MALRKRHGHSSAAVRLARAIAIHAIASAAGLAVWKAVHATSLRNGLTSTGAAIAAWLAARYARKAVRKTARKTMRGKHGRRTLAADGQGTATLRVRNGLPEEKDGRILPGRGRTGLDMQADRLVQVRKLRHPEPLRDCKMTCRSDHMPHTKEKTTMSTRTMRAKAAETARSILSDNNVLILDTETTGLERGRYGVWDHIVDLGIADANKAVVCNMLFNPGMPMPEAASRINGITDAMLEGKPSINDYAPAISALLNGRTVVGWNIGFDDQMLTHELAEAGMPRTWHTVDAMSLYCRFMGFDRPFHKLSLAMKECGIVEEQTHRALEDVLNTIEVLRFMAACRS